MRIIVPICLLPILALCFAGCGGDDAGGFTAPEGSVTVKLDTFQAIADQTPDPTLFTITLDGEVVGRTLSGSVDYALSIDGTTVTTGALAVDGTVANITSLREATITVAVPNDLAGGEHTLRGELDPNGRIGDQIDHELWAVRTETFTTTVDDDVVPVPDPTPGPDPDPTPEAWTWALVDPGTRGSDHIDTAYNQNDIVLFSFTVTGSGTEQIDDIDVAVITDSETIIDQAWPNETDGHWSSVFTSPSQAGDHELRMTAHLADGSSHTSPAFLLEVVAFDIDKYAGSYDLDYYESLTDDDTSYAPGQQVSLLIGSDESATFDQSFAFGAIDYAFYFDASHGDWTALSWESDTHELSVHWDVIGTGRVLDFATFDEPDGAGGTVTSWWQPPGSGPSALLNDG